MRPAGEWFDLQNRYSYQWKRNGLLNKSTDRLFSHFIFELLRNFKNNLFFHRNFQLPEVVNFFI